MHVTKIKCLSGLRKHRYELVGGPKKQSNRTFIDKEWSMKVILDYSTTTGHIFRTTLGFKKYDIILNKEKSVLTKNKKFIRKRKDSNKI